MRTLNLEADSSALIASLRSGVRADYVYMYPPRQAYRPLDPHLAREHARASLARSGPLNLYIHVPFCRQICAYCNLYAVAGSKDSEHERYVDLVLQEARHFATDIGNRSIDTVYIGGGTPSMLSGQLIGKLTSGISSIFDFDIQQVPEVAIEVSPDTITHESARDWRSAGINRINLGAQTLDGEELQSIGRRYELGLQNSAIVTAMSTGFTNVCVDLIYGLPMQTTKSWCSSLRAVLAHRPETICCYALTLRPETGYARKGHTEVDAKGQFVYYDIAHSMLLDSGYMQETAVRWVLPGLGGYRQKSNHWSGQDIIGFGAGARSYLYDVDLRNGYSVTKRRGALNEYSRNVRDRGHGITDGFIMTDEERARKDIILGLGSLDRRAFAGRYGVDPLEAYPRAFDCLIDTGLVEITGTRLSLTDLGQRHRDVAVQFFFSDHVRELVAEHSYDE